jgi:hypothetical protein
MDICNMAIKLTIFFLLLIPSLSFSQGFVPGYVLLKTGDTVRGLLKHPFGNPYGFRFKEANNIKREFPKQDVTGFYMEKEGLFKPILFAKDSMEHIVKVYAEGYLSYYEVQVGTTISAYYHILQKKDTHEHFWYNSDLFSGFKNGILAYLSDDTALCEKIRHGEYQRKDVLSIVHEYNSFRAARR